MEGGDADKEEMRTTKRPPDVKINVIFPATEVHIRKVRRSTPLRVMSVD